MPTALSRMEPQHAKIEPPPGAVAHGVTSDGRQIFRLVTKRARAVPRYENTPEARELENRLASEGKSETEIRRAMDKAGFRLWRKNQNTGEPMYPINKAEVYDLEELFTLESEGNWNVRKIPYRFPTAEELAVQERARQVSAMQEALPALLVDEGFTAEELLAALRAGRNRPAESPPVASPPVMPDFSAYPKRLGKNRWELSDGREVRMTEERAQAEEAEVQDRVLRAAQAARETPEY